MGASRLSRLRSLARKFRDYVRYDLHDVVWPRPIDDPPDYKPPPKMTWRQSWEAFKLGSQDYVKTWKGLEPEKEEEAKSQPKEPTLAEELALAARSAQGMKPVLIKLYQSQMSVYQKSIQSFVQGYRQGVNEKVDLDSWLGSMGTEDIEKVVRDNQNTVSREESRAENDTQGQKEIISEHHETVYDPNAILHKESIPNLDLMSDFEIDEWNANIMKQNRLIDEAKEGLNIERDYHSEFNHKRISGQSDAVKSSSQNSESTSLPSSNEQFVDIEDTESPSANIEEEIGRALAHAEKLGKVIQSGNFTNEERQEFQRAIDRVDGLVSSNR